MSKVPEVNRHLMSTLEGYETSRLQSLALNKEVPLENRVMVLAELFIRCEGSVFGQFIRDNT